MNKISKIDLKDLLIKKFNEKDEVLVGKVVDEIYDLDIKEVFPLDDIETFVFRKRYGVYDDGLPISKENLEKQLNIGYIKIQKILERSFSKLGFRINKIEKRKKEEKMGSFPSSKNKDILVTNLNISNGLKNTLMKLGVFTLKELLEISNIEYKRVVSDKLYIELVDYIHLLDLKFLDELDEETKRKIFDNSSQEVIYNSTVHWLDAFKEVPNRSNSKNIKDLINKINMYSNREKDIILKEINNRGIGFKSLDDCSYEELFEMDISNIGLPKKCIDELRRIGINNIFALISLTVHDLSTRFDLDYLTIKNIINAVHSNGLVFVDEAMKMQEYTNLISESDKKKSK